MKSVMMLVLASVAALSLSAVTIVLPQEGETMCLLNDGNKAFLSMDAAARRAIFTNKDWRREAFKKWGSTPKPVTLRWKDAQGGKVHVTVTKKGADKPWFDEDVTGESVEVWNLEIARATISVGGVPIVMDTDPSDHQRRIFDLLSAKASCWDRRRSQ